MTESILWEYVDVNCAEAGSARVMFGLGFAVCCTANITAGQVVASDFAYLLKAL